MTLGEELDLITASGQWRALDDLLGRLDADGVQEAERWYRANRAPLHAAARDWSSPVDHDGVRSCCDLLAVSLAPSPEKAAAWFGWHHYWRSDGGEPLAAVVQRMGDRGREWCAAFLEAASTRVFRGDFESDAIRLARIGLPLAEHFDLPLPMGGSFAQGWTEHYGQLMSQAAWEARRGTDGVPRRADHLPPSGTTRLRFDEHGRLRAHRQLVAEQTLAGQWRVDPLLRDVLPAAVERPGTLGTLVSTSVQGWELGPAVAAMVDEGRLERERLLEVCLQALTRDEPAATQKALATVLTALGFSAGDAKGRVPLLLGAMATARGPVTAVLLPVLLDTVSGPEEMAELAVTVFSRKEKRQRTELLRALVHREAVDRLGREAVVAGLAAAAESDDESLAGRARRALAGLGVEAERPAPQPVADLWCDPAPAPPPQPFRQVEPTPEGLTAALSAFSTGGLGHVTARFLDAFVRWAWDDRAGFAAFLRSAWPRHDWQRPEVVNRAADWAHGGLDRAQHEKEVAKIRFYHGGVWRPYVSHDWHLSSMPVTWALVRLHVSETLLAAGSVPCLLSTPSDEGGSVSFDDLHSRLRSYRDAPCGELDLFQALLRLEPVDPTRADELDGVVVTLRGREATGLRRLLRGTRSPGADAAGVVRQWVAGGGLPALEVRAAERGLHVGPAELPVPLDVFPSVPPDLVAGHQPGRDKDFSEYQVAADTTIDVVPHWPELVVAKTQSSFDQSSTSSSRWLEWLVEAPGIAGPAVHHALAATLGHADEAARLRGVDATLALMARGRFDSGDFERACLALLGRGKLRLARTTSAWEQVVLGGGMKPLWPAVTAVVEAACRLERRPAGLAELLSLARRYAAAAPGAVVPPAVVEIARTRGASKVHVEARAWVRDVEVPA
ncbi:hypothetical protein P0Y31_00875 [Knoellia sp. 3-2P3]|uniref:hypothetical protein n=1 Tax=unclassified Knoellia TaxID=2618719 RepID=UPI0023DAECC0|nr:hypothetical protein [Knoellia sp. 3-2P3]MDF2090885.1 hypothetical protein [Knoellia sp. 3-2P3]